jgi:hypothetical protein
MLPVEVPVEESANDDLEGFAQARAEAEQLIQQFDLERRHAVHAFAIRLEREARCPTRNSADKVRQKLSPSPFVVQLALGKNSPRLQSTWCARWMKTAARSASSFRRS